MSRLVGFTTVVIGLTLPLSFWGLSVARLSKACGLSVGGVFCVNFSFGF